MGQGKSKLKPHLKSRGEQAELPVRRQLKSFAQLQKQRFVKMMIQPASTIRKSLLPMPSSKNAVPVNWLMLIFVKVSFIMTSAALNDTAISKYQPILTRIKVLII